MLTPGEAQIAGRKVGTIEALTFLLLGRWSIIAIIVLRLMIRGIAFSVGIILHCHVLCRPGWVVVDVPRISWRGLVADHPSCLRAVLSSQPITCTCARRCWGCRILHVMILRCGYLIVDWQERRHDERIREATERYPKEKGGEEGKVCNVWRYGEWTGPRSIDSSSGNFVFLFLFLFFSGSGGWVYSFALQLSFLSARNRESPCQQNDHGKNDRDRPRLNRDRQRGRDGEGQRTRKGWRS